MFYIKIWEFFGNFSRHTLIKMYTKTHQTAHFPKLACAPEPPSICVQL